MVRANSTPLRILALDYGADVVYSEELIARRLELCTRKENEELKTIDFADVKPAQDDVSARGPGPRKKINWWCSSARPRASALLERPQSSRISARVAWI